jgi:Uma2 family endonuclease
VARQRTRRRAHGTARAVRQDRTPTRRPGTAVSLKTAESQSAADVFLLLEVSDSTLRYDVDVKVPLYARHGVPEVWVIDLKHHTLHVYRSPVQGGYQYIASVPDGGSIAIPGVGSVTVNLSEILDG